MQASADFSLQASAVSDAWERPVVKTQPTTTTESGYGFRSWKYVTVQGAVKEDSDIIDMGVDTCCTMSITDKDWYLSQHPGVAVSQTQSPVTVRGIGSTKHASSEYVQGTIFLEGNSNESPAMIKILRDIHLVKDLGVKMLIGMDILGPEGAVVDLPAERLRLGKSIVCPLKIKSLGKRQERIVHSAGPIVAKPFSVINVPIKLRKSLPKGRDYIFEPRTLSIDLGRDGGAFAHVVDSEVYMVQVKNALPHAVNIPRKLKLGKIVECEEEGCFLTISSEAQFAVRPSWKKRIAIAALAATQLTQASPGECVLSNGVTIFQPDLKTDQVKAI